MNQTIETAFYLFAIIFMSIILLKLGEKIGEHIARKYRGKSYDFRKELKKIIEDWKKRIEGDEN